jgi:hypothetical protein
MPSTLPTPLIFHDLFILTISGEAHRTRSFFLQDLNKQEQQDHPWEGNSRSSGQ